MAQCELGGDGLTPDTNVATLVQRILKSGVLAHKGVEYRCVGGWGVKGLAGRLLWARVCGEGRLCGRPGGED